MNLVDKITTQLPFNKKSETPEYFFALNINLSQLTASVWEVFENKLEILSQATVDYQGSNELVDKAYQALDQSLGSLDIDPQKVLFGVPDAWSQDDDLKEPYLKLLRKLLKEADLQPMAYVLTTNALSFYLQRQEGAPPTAILLGFGDFIESTLVRGGKVMESRVVERSGELFDDVEKVLHQLHDSEVLPSKILLYPTKNKENLSKIKDQLMSFQWMQKLSFLHFPKIEVLDNNICSESIIAAAAAEINPEIDLKHSFAASAATVAPKGVLEPVEEESDFGFVQGDIKDRLTKRPPLEKTVEGDMLDEGDDQVEELEREEAEEKEYQTADLEDDNLVSPDLPEEELLDQHYEETLPQRKPLPVLPNDEDIIMPHTAKHSVAGKGRVSLPSVLGQMSGVVEPLMAKLPRLPKNGALMGKLGLLVLVLAGLIGAFLFFSKATVTVYVEPRVLEKEAQVVADPAATAVNEANNIIPGTVVQTTVNGTGKTSASGQKQIGDPAKGKVILYNQTESKVSISAGTTLTSGSGLKFTLDSAVQIASQSSSIGADLTTVIKPGKSDSVGVTASAIGPDSNLPADTDLSVSGYGKSQVLAKVSEALSGGTSKNVTVVTADDQKKLKAQVLDDLKQKAEADLQSKMTDGKKVIADGLSVVDGKYTFSKDVNDQATEVSLNASVQFKGVAYSENDLRTIVGKLVETNVPDGYVLDLTSTETQADVIKVEKDGKLVFGAKFKAKLMPKFNTDEMKKQMIGKNIATVVSQLKGLENVVGSEIKLSPMLPAPMDRLPFLSQNITIVVTPK